MKPSRHEHADAVREASQPKEVLLSSRSLLDTDERQVDEKTELRWPLTYWDDLRDSNFTYETAKGSAMIRVQDTDRNETLRLGHVVSLNPYSEILPDGTRVRVDLLVYIEGAAFLALHHFNQRSPEVLPHLPERLDGCDIYMTMDIVDTVLSPLTASEKAMPYLARKQNSLRQPRALSIAGAARSGVSQPLAVLAGVYNVPMVNGVSTSSALDIKDNSPTFLRTAPINKYDSQAVVMYFKSLGVFHFGVLFVRDPYGSEFNRDLMEAASANGMTVVSAPYEDGSDRSIADAVKQLRDSQFRYFFAAITPSADSMKSIVKHGLNLGIAGNPDYLWLFTESNIIEDGFYESTLDSSLESDRKIANAITGMGAILLDIPPNERFDTAMRGMGTNQELYEYFVSRHGSPEVFDSFVWKPNPFFYQYLSYDYIMALGIGLCDMEEDFPAGLDIVEAVKGTEFDGVSGPVSFDNVTGTRTADSVRFKLVNVIVDVQEGSIKAEYRDSGFINGGTGQVEILTPYIYASGTTVPPEPLPPLRTVDTNLIGNGARISGWCICALVVLLSFGFAIWTFKRRNWTVVRAAQPFFLCLLCVGTVLMASAIIPMSLQEPTPTRGLNIACMAVPWLFIMGFSTAFSSLFCKALRLNKVFREAAGMRRVQVKIKDVMWPFAVLSAANFSLLLAWTLVAPLEWTRVKVDNFDQFGRSVESYGTCFAVSEEHRSRSSKSYGARNGFLIALGVSNFGAVVFANYQGYLARRLPSDFNESFYLVLSMASVLEGFLIGVPIMFLGYDNPTVFYIVGSLLIAFWCLAILLPTFISKMHIERTQGLNKDEWHSAWSSYAGSRHASSETTNRLTLPKQSIDSRSRDVRSSSDVHSSCEPTGRTVNLPQRTTVADIRARVAEKNASMSQRSTVADIRARVAEKNHLPQQAPTRSQVDRMSRLESKTSE